MNARIAMGVIMLMFISVISYGQQNNDLVGTWKLKSYTYNNQEKKFVGDSIVKVKFITPSHFIWVYYESSTKIAGNSAGGSYTYDGVNYIENVDFAGKGMAYIIGMKSTFKVKIENNLMVITGSFGNNYPIEEEWEKVIPSK
jgi:hypothetical protein